MNYDELLWIMNYVELSLRSLLRLRLAPFKEEDKSLLRRLEDKSLRIRVSG